MGALKKNKNKNNLALSDVIWSGEVFAKGVDPIRQWNSNMVPPKINAAGMHLRRICRCPDDNIRGFQGECLCFGPKGMEELVAKTKTLYLSMNDFDSAEGIERFRELRSLSLSDNFLRWVPRELRLLGDLRRLNIAGNRFEELYWREKVLYLCPRLVELDGAHITDTDREDSICVYQQACMLWNVLELVKGVVGILGTELCGDAAHGIGLLVELRKNVYQSIEYNSEEEDDTIEFFYCALKRATDGCLAIVGDDGMYPCVTSSCGDMVASCVDVWRSIGYHSWEDEFDLSEMLEKLRDAWEDGDLDEVERVAFEVWSEFYVFVCNLNMNSETYGYIDDESMSVLKFQDDLEEEEEEEEEEPEREEGEEEEEVRKIEQCIADYTKILNEKDAIVAQLKEKLESVQLQNAVAKTELQAEREATRRLCMDKREMTTVVCAMQQSLEESKQDQERLQQAHTHLQYELNKHIDEKKRVQSNYEELKRLHMVVSDESVHRVEELRRHVLALEQEIDVLKKQPIIPLCISIVSLDVTDALKSKDGRICVLQERVDDLELRHALLDKTQAFRQSWDEVFWKRGAQRSFHAWREYCGRRSIVAQFEKRLSTLHSRTRKKCIFDALLLSTTRSRRIDGIVAQRELYIRRRIIMTWKSHVDTCRMVRDFADRRLASTQKRALDAMHDNNVQWKNRLRQNSQKAMEFHDHRNQMKALHSWITEYNLSKLENAAKLCQHATGTAMMLLRRCLLSWQDSAEDNRLDEQGNILYRLQSDENRATNVAGIHIISTASETCI